MLLLELQMLLQVHLQTLLQPLELQVPWILQLSLMSLVLVL